MMKRSAAKASKFARLRSAARQHWVGRGAPAAAADQIVRRALRADDEAVGGESVEVRADALGRHEARGAAPVRVGFVLESQRFAHLVERVAGPAADVTLANDRIFSGRRQACGGTGFAE